MPFLCLQGIGTAICERLEQAFPVDKITTHASITAKPFFTGRGYKVKKEQQVIRNGIALTNFVMEKTIGKGFGYKMDMGAGLLQRKRPVFSLFEEYGLLKTSKGYHFETDFMNGDFRAVIDIDTKGKLSGKVIDKMNDEEYTSFFNTSQNGAFVNSVRSAYAEVIADIAEKCYEDVYFASEQANRITEKIYNKFGDKPDFPWGRDPYLTAGTFRHADTSKWYGLIMNIKKSLLDKEEGDKQTDVLNLKINEDDREKLQSEEGIYPAYHMNHKCWISVILDETISDERIMELVVASYRLTDKKRKRQETKRVPSGRQK